MGVKVERMHLRICAEDKLLIALAARAAQVSASRFMTDAAVQVAEETIARQNRYVIPVTQWIDFTRALDAVGAGGQGR